MKKMTGITLLFMALALGACGGNKNELSKPKQPEEAAPVNARSPIRIDLMNTEGKVVGEAKITESNKGLSIYVQAKGLEPGKRAIHIHETGKCDPPDFKTAGAHFNPFEKEHGFHNPKGYHAGDLPNLTVGQGGRIDEVVKSADLTLQKGKPNSILDEDGSALVIHSGQDVYRTDPAGNAGDRMVCGLISDKGK